MVLVGVVFVGVVFVDFVVGWVDDLVVLCLLLCDLLLIVRFVCLMCVLFVDVVICFGLGFVGIEWLIGMCSMSVCFGIMILWCVWFYVFNWLIDML